MTQALISVGSNKNNPQMQIETAFAKMNERFDNARMSSLYLTEPVGGVPQDAFTNAAISLDTQLSASELLSFLMDLELQAQRNRDVETPMGPRSLDLDIILYGDMVISETDLKIPHPRFRERRFVLEPLNEIAPLAIDPHSKQSISQLLEDCKDASWVKHMDEALLAL